MENNPLIHVDNERLQLRDQLAAFYFVLLTYTMGNTLECSKRAYSYADWALEARQKNYGK